MTHQEKFPCYTCENLACHECHSSSRGFIFYMLKKCKITPHKLSYTLKGLLPVVPSLPELRRLVDGKINLTPEFEIRLWYMIHKSFPKERVVAERFMKFNLERFKYIVCLLEDELVETR